MDSEATSAKRESILGMAVTGVRNLLAVSNYLIIIFCIVIKSRFKVDEMSRTKTMRASTSFDEVDALTTCVPFMDAFFACI
jgi:hypothetical protein